MATEQEILSVKKLLSRQLLGEPGVSGVGVEGDNAGNFFLTVYVDDMKRPIVQFPPVELQTHPFKFVESGPFVKYGNR